MLRSNAWNKFYAQHPNSGGGDKNLKGFAGLTSKEKSENERRNAVFEDEDAVGISVAPVTGRVRFLHSFADLGGTRSRPEHKFVALDGRGSSAQPVLISEQ